MSYGHKSDFQDGGRRHLEFLKISIFGHLTTAFAICTKFHQNRTIFHWHMAIYRFLNGCRPPSWILNICRFCHLALVDMPFCFLIQNFAEIGESVDELWPKKHFSRWRPPPSWILKISIFGHVTTAFAICTKFHQNPTISHWHNGDLTIFKMTAVQHLAF